MKFLFTGGVGIGKTIAVVAINRPRSDGINLYQIDGVEIDTRNVSHPKLKMEPRGRIWPCKLPSGYKTENY